MKPADPPWQLAVQWVKAASSGTPLESDLRVTLHFHPDRTTGRETVMAALGRDGRYRSQFETGTSNGGLTAHPGGDRWQWESRLFSGVYDHGEPSARPIYGSLNHRRRAIGGSPRFGSCYLRLNADSLDKTTFCFPDSVFQPTHLAVRETGSTLIDLADSSRMDALDDYIEAHVHGGVDLGRDAEAIVLDPCYRGTHTEHQAAALGLPIEWHAGYRLSVEELEKYSNYRGPEVVALGTAIAVDGHLDAAIISLAAETSSYDPQMVKKVWHCLARFGALGDGWKP